MIQQNKFESTFMDGLNLHLEVFLEYIETLKFNSAYASTIRLWLFPFFFKGQG